MANDTGATGTEETSISTIDFESMSELIEAQLSDVSGGAFGRSRQFLKSVSQ